MVKLIGNMHGNEGEWRTPGAIKAQKKAEKYLPWEKILPFILSLWNEGTNNRLFLFMKATYHAIKTQ